MNFPEQPTVALDEVIRSSWFTVEPGNFVYTRVREVGDPSPHLLVIHEREDITVVTEEQNLRALGVIDRNAESWKLITVRCGNPFYCVGFIAYITGALARKGIDIVLTSSFSNDLILVMEKNLAAAHETLLEIGFRQKY